jgi:hypothetical protein
MTLPTLTEIVTAATGLLTDEIFVLLSAGAVLGLGARFIGRIARALR